MKKQYRLTQEGVEELKAELDELVSQRGPIAERIKSAREFGDLTENAEYTSAMQEKEKTESRISEVEHILLNYELINKPKKATKVQIGSSVSLKNNGLSKQFQVVGTVEADPLEGKISDESPIGQALLGKKVGDDVQIKTNSDTVTYKVAEIS